MLANKLSIFRLMQQIKALDANKKLIAYKCNNRETLEDQK